MGTLPKNGRSEATTTASPEQVWDVLADPVRLGEWSHETTTGTWLDGATSARVGARFRGENRVGRMTWKRTNEVVTADAPREFAWVTVPSAVYRDSTEWRITLEPVEGGTRIVQTFRVLHINPLLDRLFFVLVKPHRDRSTALNSDIDRLGRVAASGAQSQPLSAETPR